MRQVELGMKVRVLSIPWVILEGVSADERLELLSMIGEVLPIVELKQAAVYVEKHFVLDAESCMVHKIPLWEENYVIQDG